MQFPIIFTHMVPFNIWFFEERVHIENNAQKLTSNLDYSLIAKRLFILGNPYSFCNQESFLLVFFLFFSFLLFLYAFLRSFLRNEDLRKPFFLPEPQFS